MCEDAYEQYYALVSTIQKKKNMYEIKQIKKNMESNKVRIYLHILQ